MTVFDLAEGGGAETGRVRAVAGVRAVVGRRRGAASARVGFGAWVVSTVSALARRAARASVSDARRSVSETRRDVGSGFRAAAADVSGLSKRSTLTTSADGCETASAFGAAT